MTFLPIFVLFNIHDCRAMPYKNNYLNLLQILSTLSLLFIATCNLVNAFAYMADITGIPGITVVMDVLGYVENIITIALIPLWLIVLEIWKPSEKKKSKDKQD